MSQTEFRSALLGPGQITPAGLRTPSGQPAHRRFAVYRNNVAVSLTEALEAGFPVVRALVGEEFFRAMAGVFLRAHPPRTPVLMLWGDDFPSFIHWFEPVSQLGYLADVARVEQAFRESYHAADSVPVGADRLATLGPEALLAARLTLAPALRLVRSDWPAGAIWHAHTTPGAPEPAMRAEDVLIARPGFDPVVTVLPPGGGALVAALARGLPLGTALAAAPPGHDLATTLGALLAGGAITGAVLED